MASMIPGRRAPRLLRGTARVAYLVLAGLASVLALSSYFVYTTAGFDFEIPAGPVVATTYYRLRWDDGSTWIGRSVHPEPSPDRPLDWFDPGGLFGRESIRPEHRTWANALGFWWITRPEDDPYVHLCYGNATASRWAAVPSWLVVLALWVGPIARRSRWRRAWLGRRDHAAVAAGPTRLVE